MELKGLFVGLTTIDIQYLVDTFPALNSKSLFEKVKKQPVGATSNES